MNNIALVLLAAGGSARMGSPKQLLSYQGKPLVRHAAETALASGCDPVMVVLGAKVDEIRAALDGLDLVIVENTDWEQGIGSSIRAGISGAEIMGCDGAVLASADQPLLTAEIFKRLVEEHEETGRPIIASEYSDNVGIPAFFAKEIFPQLKALLPSEDGKAVILANLDLSIRIACPEAETDLDTPGDYLSVMSQ
ncbi:MAG TPA: nucleotidyltransferase family protein [Bryobacteraceae bacterium]|jgi:molybdenum cofactor cytidylyltransferase